MQGVGVEDGIAVVDEAPPTRSRRRIVLLSLAAVLGMLLVWLVGSVWIILSNGERAQDALAAAKTDILAGDFAAATASAEDAEASVAEASSAVHGLPVQLVGLLPVAGPVVDDLERIVDSAADVAAASRDVVDVYGEATGKAQDGRSVFSGGRADFAVIGDVTGSVARARGLLEDAEATLKQVQGGGPGSDVLLRTRDEALGQVAPLADTLGTFERVLARVPDALGKDAPRSYLLITVNPAELYAGGGAALSAAVVRFDKGEMSIPVRGSVSSTLFPQNPRVYWKHIAGAPFYNNDYPAAFAWSTLHPDFTVTAREVARSWVANGEDPVDGVISVDPVALAAALRVTGPIETPGYGEITADNLVQKLLVDGYQSFDGDQGERHALNDSLVDTVFTRLSGGQGALSMLQAMATTAPARHFRVWMSDEALQKEVLDAGLAGQLPDARGADAVAFYSQNQNGSKVDVFQQRDTVQRIWINPDGSADALTTVNVVNGAPRSARGDATYQGYFTSWSFNWYLAYLPPGAQFVDYTATRSLTGDRDDPTVYRDVSGWSLVRVGRWTRAGAVTELKVRYRFPAGYFSDAGGGYHYRLVTVPQSLVQPATLTVEVRAPGTATVDSDLPGGWSTTTPGLATWSGTLAQPSSTDMLWR